MELIPKETQKLPNWFNILFLFSFIILIGVIVSYFIIVSYANSYQNELNSLNDSISKIQDDPDNIALEKKVLDAEKKINDFGYLINKHTQVLSVFDFVKNNCHPKVWFSNFNLDVNKGTLILSGTADDLDSVAQQVMILKNNSLLTKVNLDSFSLDLNTGKVNFGLSLVFDPKIFQ